MTCSDEAGSLFKAGRLADAVEAAGRDVRANPTDAGRRMLLAELLLFTGDFERADTVLVAAEALQPDMALVGAEFRQLLRAATARRQLTSDGRVPEFLGEPTPTQRATLRAFVALRAGDATAAGEASEAAELMRPFASGIANGVAFDDFRDGDDLHGGSLEVLTTTGRYFWIPVERVVDMEFHPPKRPRDLFWRRCTMSVKDGPDGDVYLPALYDAPVADESLRLGRSTEWSTTAPVRGSGQRTFLVGQEGLTINHLQTVVFA